jgi:hypothetical protein
VSPGVVSLGWGFRSGIPFASIRFFLVLIRILFLSCGRKLNLSDKGSAQGSRRPQIKIGKP